MVYVSLSEQYTLMTYVKALDTDVWECWVCVCVRVRACVCVYVCVGGRSVSGIWHWIDANESMLEVTEVV